MNLNPKIPDRFDLDVWSASDAGGIDLDVVEIGVNSGIFEGLVYFVVDEESNGNRLQTAFGDVISAEYEDNTLPDPYHVSDELDIIDTAIIDIRELVINSTNDTVDAIPGDGICADANDDCTLRAAIMEANKLAGRNAIVLPSGTILLSIGSSGEDQAAGGDLDITDALDILGDGVNKTVIDARAIDRVFQIFAGVSVTMSGLTIQNGSVNVIGGGGIYNAGNLQISHCLISGNSTFGSGGGICNLGQLKLLYSTLDHNDATRNGGSLANSSGGHVDIIASSIVNNTCGSQGGGIVNSNISMTLTNCTVSGNMAGGSGGGIDNRGGTSLALTNCTITDNTAATGPGIRSTSDVMVKNTIIAGNFSTFLSDDYDISGDFISLGHNLIGLIEPGNTDFINNVIGDIVGDTGNLVVNPLLSVLQDNGGPTLTHSLELGSSAIDSGDQMVIVNPPFIGPPYYDQRGVGFDRIQDGDNDSTRNIDIGATEFKPIVFVEFLHTLSLTNSESDSSVHDVKVSINIPPGTVLPDDVTLDVIDLGTGNATAGADFGNGTFSPVTITFAAGLSSSTIHLFGFSIIDDDLIEGNETIDFGLENIQGPAIYGVSVTHQVTISDDDFSVISINDVTVAESDSGIRNAVFTVSLSPANSTHVIVDYEVVNDSALKDLDYLSSSNPLSPLEIYSGETARTISIPIIGDSIDENDETFFINLSNPQNVLIAIADDFDSGNSMTFYYPLPLTVIIADDQGVATIIDDDSDLTVDVPVLTVRDASGDEDTLIPLDIVPQLIDTDGSETLSINLSGVKGLLSKGTNTGGGNWSLEPNDLTNLALTPPLNNNQNFTISVAAISTELANNLTASISKNLDITIHPVNDPPSFLKGAAPAIWEDSDLNIVVANWATQIVPGPADESSQALIFEIDTDNQNSVDRTDRTPWSFYGCKVRI